MRFDKVSLEFGHVPLLREADLVMNAGERACLIGRNGAGKSSLLKLITGEQQPDAGRIERAPTLEVARLAQELAPATEQSVRETVAEGLGHLHELIQTYQTRAEASAAPSELAALQHQIEAHGGWEPEVRVEQVISRLELPGDEPMRSLSGGWRRRVALGAALVSDPDLLLLDEPTNHLDLAAIEWLEQEILGFRGAVLFITHDRAFMERVADRIIELDLGRLTSWDGSYRSFLRHKEQVLADEARHQELFDKRLAAEEAWVRQGIKARRTRNEGRVRALEEMRRERARRLERAGSANVQISQAGESGRKVIVAKGVSHDFGDRPLLRDFSVTILRGDRVGIVGNNGVGKSTLLRILLGDLQPKVGSVKLGTRLEIAYFDQLRASLEPEKTIAENVGQGREFVTVNGREKHVISYMEDFLFSPERARTPVKALSGGERNRVILAQLLARPANLLVMDEPTNDLDIETLEVLEARLAQYEGTLLLVSHDRVFLDNVVTSVLVFEKDGLVHEYVGGYEDWAARGRELAEVERPRDNPAPSAPRKPSPKSESPRPQRKRLSYKEQRELDALPDRIEALEARVEALQAEISSPDFYQGEQEKIQATLAEFAETSEELEAAVDRWAELES
ncbi:MAG: ATP-binding cassette domain-containing protein [Xanthomonadales bacterium]|nr:ATP-binding cassette domain-containing protein [Xanthomonadales bacterium]